MRTLGCVLFLLIASLLLIATGIFIGKLAENWFGKSERDQNPLLSIRKNKTTAGNKTAAANKTVDEISVYIRTQNDAFRVYKMVPDASNPILKPCKLANGTLFEHGITFFQAGYNYVCFNSTIKVVNQATFQRKAWQKFGDRLEGFLRSHPCLTTQDLNEEDFEETQAYRDFFNLFRGIIADGLLCEQDVVDAPDSTISFQIDNDQVYGYVWNRLLAREQLKRDEQLLEEMASKSQWAGSLREVRVEELDGLVEEFLADYGGLLDFADRRQIMQSEMFVDLVLAFSEKLGLARSGIIIKPSALYEYLKKMQAKKMP